MSERLQVAQEATPNWLTTVLRESGALAHGEVVSVQSAQNDAFNSSVAHLLVDYSEAQVTLPRRLLLKLDQHQGGELEIPFYKAAMQANLPMLVRAYAADYHAESGTSLLILEDVSQTHGAPITRERLLGLDGVPTEPHLYQIVDGLAQFHAYWWEHPQLGQDFGQVRGWYTDYTHYQQHIERRQREFSAFVTAVGDEIPVELRTLYETLLAKFPSLWDAYLAPRVTTYRHLTLTHGDCYLTQFLCPNDSTGMQSYLVDFQAVSGNFSAHDLVYMFSTFWTPEQRRHNLREATLLHRYYEGLRTFGVDSYAWEDLLRDYRLMILYMLFDPVWNQISGSPKSYWWPKMRCLWGAFQDWDCVALLENS